MGRGELRIVADDLTGACDVGVEWLPWEGGVGVQVGPSAPRGDARLVVQNTASRTLAPQAAAAAVRRVLADVAGSFRGILLKKVDTALRGQLGAELEAVLQLFADATCIVAPAIPEVGRLTRGGCQYLDGVRIDRTALAHDPQNPVAEASIAAAISAGCSRPVAHASVADVRSGKLGRLFAVHSPAGRAIIVADAETDHDLARIVDAALGAGRPLVLVGSTGLARQLRCRLGPGSGERPGGQLPLSRPVLVVSGSAHPAAWRQIELASQRGLFEAVTVAAGEGEGAGRRAGEELVCGNNVALCAPRPVTARATEPERQLFALAIAARAALGATVPGSVVLIGGETAGAVLQAMGSPPLLLEGRLAPLVAMGRVAAGPYRGLAVVTKGGSSGKRELLATLLSGGEAGT